MMVHVTISVLLPRYSLFLQMEHSILYNSLFLFPWGIENIQELKRAGEKKQLNIANLLSTYFTSTPKYLFTFFYF